jgi:hypothetical protein
MAQVVECLPSKCKALRSKPSIAKYNKIKAGVQRVRLEPGARVGVTIGWNRARSQACTLEPNSNSTSCTSAT